MKVYELKNISKASEVLYVSQPSISYSIKELENQFGVTLFRRQHNGMALTDEGEIFFNLASNLISHAEDVERIMYEIGNGKKLLRLGVPPMIGSLVLPVIYRDYIIKYPDIELKITEGGTNEILKLLNSDQLDMVLIPHNSSIDSQLKSTKIAQFEIVCYAHKNNSISKKDAIMPYDLKNENLVLFKNSFFQTEQIKRWFSCKNVEPKILLQTDQLSTLINIIESNQAIGFMFKELINKKPDLVAIPLKEQMKIEVSLVWRKEKSFEAMKGFADFVKTIKL